MEKGLQKSLQRILNTHVANIDRSEVSAGEKKAQEEREMRESFMLTVGSIFTAHGLKYSHVGKAAEKATKKRLEALGPQLEMHFDNSEE